jgi:hypothetical protein
MARRLMRTEVAIGFMACSFIAMYCGAVKTELRERPNHFIVIIVRGVALGGGIGAGGEIVVAVRPIMGVELLIAFKVQINLFISKRENVPDLRADADDARHEGPTWSPVPLSPVS